jgi:HKD family nuclease
MQTITIAQPEVQLGVEISELLDASERFTSIRLVSAFVGLRTILRLRDQLLARVAEGADLRLTVGIDMGGTSREVLEELLRWDCEVFVFHNAIPRSTFHPKFYLFETESSATLFIGSNNLTDGGFFTNYEVSTKYEFEFPEDNEEFERIVAPLRVFLEPSGITAQRLDDELIEILSARGDLLTEAEARSRRSRQSTRPNRLNGDIPTNPFGAVATPMPPLLPRDLRAEEPPVPETEREEESAPVGAQPVPIGFLVWKKVLSASDALQVNEGTAHVGGVRLTQARFENPPGDRIDQTSYFRQLFADYHWEAETGRHRGTDQEHAFVPMRIIIRGVDYGIRNFEISHKPSGEAGQNNYTTILRWGRDFIPIIQDEVLTDAMMYLYETGDDDAGFFINIVDE